MVAEAAGYVRDFNRFEFKYVVPERTAREFAAGLEGYAHADPHSGPGGYPVHSVYWDSPELTFFWEKLDGEKYRRKLRFRRYEGSDDVFIEIKQRIDRTVQKRRVLWPVERARALFDVGHIDPVLESEVDERVVMEALFLCRYHDLAPKMAVAYRREAFFGTFETDLRITFDRRIQYDPHALDLREPFKTGKYMLDPDRVVIEIKFNHRVPLWLTKLVQKNGLELQRLSKYCSAVDRELFQGRYG
jgi:hypothetical protein